MCNIGFLCAVSACNSNTIFRVSERWKEKVVQYLSHLWGERVWCGVCFYLTWRQSLRLIKPHSSLTHIWAQLHFLLHTHPEGGKYYVHHKLWTLWTQDTAKDQKLTYTTDIGCENKLTGMADKDYNTKAVGQKICWHGICHKERTLEHPAYSINLALKTPSISSAHAKSCWAKI